MPRITMHKLSNQLLMLLDQLLIAISWVMAGLVVLFIIVHMQLNEQVTVFITDLFLNWKW